MLIDPETQTVELYRASREPARYRGTVDVPPEPELPGFFLDTAPVFA